MHDKVKEALPCNLVHDAVMGSHEPASRKPTADDWEAHRGNITRLYIDENLALSAIQDRLREDHDCSTT
jgi:hypothetical protein